MSSLLILLLKDKKVLDESWAPELIMSLGPNHVSGAREEQISKEISDYM